MTAFLFNAATAVQTLSLNPPIRFKPQKYRTGEGDQHDPRRHLAKVNVSHLDRKVGIHCC